MKRKLPRLTPDTAPFWSGDGGTHLLIHRCRSCTRYFHIPGPMCPNCGSLDVAPEPVSGKGHVYSFTINYQNWAPGLEEPYVVAIVELAEQEGIRLVTNILNIDVNDVHIGMPVKVAFEQIEDIRLPLFIRDQDV